MMDNFNINNISSFDIVSRDPRVIQSNISRQLAIYKREIQRAIFGIIKPEDLVLKQSTIDEDMKEAKDLAVIWSSGFALRIRQDNKKYKDVTISTNGISNGNSEWDKYRQGFGNLYLYVGGAGTETNPNFWRYIIWDIEKARNNGMFEEYPKESLCGRQRQTAMFTTISYDTLYKMNAVVKVVENPMPHKF